MKTERENTKSYQQHDINHENKHFGIKKSSEKKKANRSSPHKKMLTMIAYGKEVIYFSFCVSSKFSF